MHVEVSAVVTIVNEALKSAAGNNNGIEVNQICGRSSEDKHPRQSEAHGLARVSINR